ncbi:cell division chloroplastic isoform B [Chlorella sorokiniana]|uniref:Cell division chloroplastic isoform B n=1 Tax=Chlorella sorokiniana TaxID=3076 RepID=A0A2P6U426_CHLSO|nr:cell division chloroplastic isoform B [Chlorella sorokiniana]|eukprot:PRW61059.1 cell division chloroplastic isoform B [Chlorella sorokiniana]
MASQAVAMRPAGLQQRAAAARGAAAAAAAPPAAAPMAAVRQRRRSVQVRAQTAAPGSSVLGKLARVFKEKAAQDLDRIRKGTSKTREKLGVIEELFTYWNLDDADETLEELEDALIMSDFGPKTAFKIVDGIRDKVMAGQLKTGEQIRAELKASIASLLQQRGGSSELALPEAKPAVLLVVGVNGGGKTTTIGKLANKFASEGAKVVLAAGDTFRAAAAEQLEEWARRSGAEIVRAQGEKARPDTVLYQAVDTAVKSGADLVLCDTSGRLHTNWSLMDELAKCKRSITKRLPEAPHEVLLVLDGTTGLNMLNQAKEFNETAKEFNETVQLSGIILTKLDGTARGGAVVSVVDELGVPVKFVGVGEGIEDLQPFDPLSFVDALFPEGSAAAESEAA